LRGPASTGGADALSEQPADARTTLQTAHSAPGWRDISLPRWVASAGLGAIVAIAAVEAGFTGPWLDEFWTLELSNTDKGLVSLVRDGWLHDTHPPIFNAWTTLLASLGVTSIAAGRLLSNGLAVAVMIVAARRLSRRAPEQADFNTVLLLLILSLPQAIDSFATYRSYFWQIAAVGTLVFVARYVASTRVDLELRKDIDLAVIAVLATVASIGLHYVGAVFGGLLAGAIALCALRRKLRRWSALMLSATASAGLFVIASLLAQAPNWAIDLDHNWIDLPVLQALDVTLLLAAGAIAHNPVAFAGLRIGRGLRGEAPWPFVAMIGGVVVVGVAIVLAVHAFTPIVVERYLIAVAVLVCALMAVPAARIARDSLLFGLFVLVSVAVAAAPLVQSGIKPKWHEGARTIGEIVEACPTTRVFAASGWALGPAAETHAARREDRVFARAYRLLADRYGFVVQFIGQNGTAQAAPGDCPVLLWSEHTPNEAEDDLDAALDAAGITGLSGARLSVVRTATGIVVRADRP
jgi:hypothetical protein